MFFIVIGFLLIALVCIVLILSTLSAMYFISSFDRKLQPELLVILLLCIAILVADIWYSPISVSLNLTAK